MESDRQYFLNTTQRIDADVIRLRNHQSELRQRLNDLHSATRSFPPLILAKIFCHICNDLPVYEDMLINYPAVQVISRVCHRWRGIVRATPTLWTRVLLRFKDFCWASKNSLAMLQLHLIKSGELPLDILLDIPERSYYFCNRYQSSPVENQYTSFTSIFHFIFIENPTKVGSLLLTRSGGMPQKWLELIESYTTSPEGLLATEGYPNLKKLKFRTDSGGFAIHDQQQDLRIYHLFKDTPLPRLNTLSMSNREWAMHLPCENLTSLDLEVFPVNLCVDFLLSCPRLIVFRQISCINTVPKGLKPPQAQPGRFHILLNLEQLEWSFGFTDWDIYFMTRFQFPSLLKLETGHRERPTIGREPMTTDVETYWVPFLSSLTKLTNICLDTELFSTASLGFLWNCLSNLGQLVSLHITCSGFPTPDQQAEGVLRPLTLLEASKIPPQYTPLPFLTALRLDFGHIYCLSDNAEVLLLLLESRARSVKVPDIKDLWFYGQTFAEFHEPPFWERWSEERRQRLLKLIEGGLKLVSTRQELFYLKDD